MPIRRPKPAVPEYRVTRRSVGAGDVRIALTRRAPLDDRGFDRPEPREVVLAEQTFAMRMELFALESYAALLERAAEHGNRGTLGCFVQVEPARDGTVLVALYERWFHGRYLLCEQFASRRFDASREDGRTASVAYLSELRDMAAWHNHQRDAAAADSAPENTATGQGTSDPLTAAQQLAERLEAL